MEERLRSGSLVVEPVYTEREVNFSVMEGSDYLFRLVPGVQGFEISVLDKALDATNDFSVVESIGEEIDRYYA